MEISPLGMEHYGDPFYTCGMQALQWALVTAGGQLKLPCSVGLSPSMHLLVTTIGAADA